MCWKTAFKRMDAVRNWAITDSYSISFSSHVTFGPREAIFSLPWTEENRSSITNWISHYTAHQALFFTLIQEIWARQTSVIENNLSGDAAIGMARSPGLSLPMISAGGITSILQSISDFWEKEDREKERWKSSFFWHTFSPLLPLSPRTPSAPCWKRTKGISDAVWVFARSIASGRKILTPGRKAQISTSPTKCTNCFHNMIHTRKTHRRAPHTCTIRNNLRKLALILNGKAKNNSYK